MRMREFFVTSVLKIVGTKTTHQNDCNGQIYIWVIKQCNPLNAPFSSYRPKTVFLANIHVREVTLIFAFSYIFILASLFQHMTVFSMLIINCSPAFVGKNQKEWYFGSFPYATKWWGTTVAHYPSYRNTWYMVEASHDGSVWLNGMVGRGIDGERGLREMRWLMGLGGPGREEELEKYIGADLGER